jgi:RAD51-like protein 3
LCCSIARLLDGGLREGQLTEVCGPSGSGRTQLALSAAITTAARGEPVVFFDTCNSFSAARLQQLYPAVAAQQQQQPPAARLTLEQALALVTVVRPHSIFALLTSLDTLSGHIARMTDSSHRPRLLVIDSLSALVSPILGGQQHTQGTTLMVAAAQVLKQMAVRHHMAVVVTNHMTAAGAAGVPRPALGEQWRHQPSVRLQLYVDGSGARSAELVVASVGRKAGRVPVDIL